MKAKSVLLVVHDDNQVVRQIAKMTSELADLVIARSAALVIANIDSGIPISAALVGRAGGGVSAIDILSTIRAKRPQVRCILLADPSDLTLSIEALHSGVVDHVINPPLRERELLAILSLPTPRPIVPSAPATKPTPVPARSA